MTNVDAVRKLYNAAIDFALDECDSLNGMVFLDLWRMGDWPAIRAEFPKFTGPLPQF